MIDGKALYIHRANFQIIDMALLDQDEFAKNTTPIMRKEVIFMTDIEKQIENMGYEIRVIDMLNKYVVYENKKEDQEITIEWDDEDQYCMLFSETISREKDWLGHTRQMPQALTICELEIFTARLKELRGV